MHSFSIFFHQNTKIRASHIGTCLLTVILIVSSWLPTLAASQIDIVGPTGSQAFGLNITTLANGNFVVADPGYDIPNGPSDVGAVYLYNGATATVISTLTGSSANDSVGSNGVTVLANGNYVVVSSQWGTNGALKVGAVTWGSATSGVNGIVSSNNSLIGAAGGDQIGSGQIGNDGVKALTNGNYLVISPRWDNGATTDAGAVTWGNGSTGIRGVVSSSNSLVGDNFKAQVGIGGVIELTNGNYVVHSPYWPNTAVPNRGAVTWGNGATGISGVVGYSNSLLGSTPHDNVGKKLVTPLNNGNYLILTPDWDNGNTVDVGAVTWGNGNTGISGTIDGGNSLIGSKSGDQVGSGVVRIVGNGNYVVSSLLWNNGAGAVTWGNGSTGISGVVNSSNSLVGSVGSVGGIGGSQVGSGGVIVLSNGNYVVSSPLFDFLGGIVKDVGAVTWGNGDTGIKGVVSNSNSLIGIQIDDLVGSDGVTALTNGNYVVSSPSWDNFSVKDVGAATWGNGSTGISGMVSSSNSLVGSSTGDRVGDGSARPLSNGNYVVISPNWNNGAALAAGAATWGNGSAGISGAVNSSNSLVGGRSNDGVGGGYVYPLRNGNYVVMSPNWANDYGAVTLGNGVTGISGAVTSGNSLIGDMLGDKIGFLGLTLLGNDNFLVRSPSWDNGSIIDAGAVTWVNGATGISGVVNSSNSLVGSQNDEQVGLGNVIALRNDNYIVLSQFVDNGSIVDAGAVTWGNGTTGASGEVNSSNSLVGSSKDDRVGFSAMALSDGNYVVFNQHWSNGNLSKAGAITWGDGGTGVIGAVNSNNSVVGKVADGGFLMLFAEDAVNKQVIVGRSAENIITLFRLTPAEIGLTGKGIAIVDGDNSPVSNDGTDLGLHIVGSAALSQNFTISNTGDVDLTVNAITLSGAQAGDFSISGASLPTVLPANGSSEFTLNFTPSATGPRSATVNIASDDSDENPYTFVVQGTGTQHKLTTTKAGNGTGSITLSPAGGNYNHNTVVTVTAKADAGSTFAGWSGDCSGAGSCSVNMTSAKSVTATFSKNGSGNTQTVYLPLITK